MWFAKYVIYIVFDGNIMFLRSMSWNRPFEDAQPLNEYQSYAKPAALKLTQDSNTFRSKQLADLLCRTLPTATCKCIQQTLDETSILMMKNNLMEVKRQVAKTGWLLLSDKQCRKLQQDLGANSITIPAEKLYGMLSVKIYHR